MTDAVTLLTTDHRTVEGLFQQVEGRTTPDQQIVDKIVKELSIHDAIERQLLYPEVRHALEEGGAAAAHSEDEHDLISGALLRIEKADPGSEDQAAGLSELFLLVRSHVGEEESSIFPALESKLSATDLGELGDRLEAAKRKAPTRPHPHAPSEGLGATIAGTVSAPLDKAKDAVQKR